MSDLFTPNDGSRPSRLELGRAHTGETDPLGGPHAEAFAEEVEQAAEELAPFDWELLSSAAARQQAPPRPPVELAARRPWWRRAWAAPALAMAAALLLFVMVPDRSDPGPTTRAKGDVDVAFQLLRDGEQLPGVEGELFREGDVLQFDYRAAGHTSLVLLSVDGAGQLSVLLPTRGDRPVPVDPGERRILHPALELDDAPGPEIFVAVFGPADVAEARALVEEAWAQSGAEAVYALRQTDPAIDTLRIEKAER